MQRLVELAIQKDLAWLEKDLRALSRFDALYAPLGDSAELRETALEHLKRYLFAGGTIARIDARHILKPPSPKRDNGCPGSHTQFMDRLGPDSAIASAVTATHRRGSKRGAVGQPSLSSLSQLGAPAAAGAPIRSLESWPI